MKKTLLLLASALLAGSAMAQDIVLTLKTGNEVMQSGNTYYFNDMHSEDMGGYYEVKIKPNLMLSSNEDLEGILNINATCTSGQLINLCSGGQCVTNTSVDKLNLTLQTGAELDVDLYWEGEVDALDEVPQNITVNLKIWVTDEPTTEKIFTVIMNDPTHSVKILAADREVFMSGNTLYYNLTSASEMKVYDLKGNLMLTAPVKGTGSIDVSNLPKGMYTYYITGASNISGKILK